MNQFLWIFFTSLFSPRQGTESIRTLMQSDITPEYKATIQEFEERSIAADPGDEDVKLTLEIVSTISEFKNTLPNPLKNWIDQDVLNVDNVVRLALPLFRVHGWPWDLPTLHECKKVSKDETYQLVAELLQGVFKAIGIPDEQIRLMIPKLTDFFNKRNFNKEAIQKAFAQMGLFLYTADADEGGPYRDINIALAQSKQQELRKVKAPLGLILLGYNHLHQNYPEYRAAYGIFYRGMNFISEAEFSLFSPHTEFWWPQFVSASPDFEVAKKFARKDMDKDTKPSAQSVIFEITLPKHKEGMWLALKLLGRLSAFPEEKETLFYPYQKFRVTGIDKTTFPGRGLVKVEFVQKGLGELRRSHYEVRSEQLVKVHQCMMRALFLYASQLCEDFAKDTKREMNVERFVADAMKTGDEICFEFGKTANEIQKYFEEKLHNDVNRVVKKCNNECQKMFGEVEKEIKTAVQDNFPRDVQNVTQNAGRGVKRAAEETGAVLKKLKFW